MSHHPTARLSGWGAVLALAGAVALAGCTTATPQPQVATIAPSSAGSSSAPGAGAATSPGDAASTPPGGTAPRERLDMTSAELEALAQPYQDCMNTNGAPSKDEKMDADARVRAGVATAPAGDYDKALAACQQLLPLPPWEEDRSNPDAQAFVQAVVDCLHGKGIKYVEIDGDASSPRISLALGGPNNDSDSITRGMDLIPQCQREVSAAK